MHKASSKSLVKGQSSNCSFLCIRTSVLLQEKVLLNMLKSEVMYIPTSIDYVQRSRLRRGTRFTLVEWMAAVFSESRCEVEVLSVSVNIMDRFLSIQAAREQLDINELQLTAATSMFIAVKLHDYYVFSAEKIVDFRDNTYITDELRENYFKRVEI